MSFDGKLSQPLRRGDTLVIKTSNFPVPTICKDDSTADWFASLDQALGFNTRMKQRVRENESPFFLGGSPSSCVCARPLRSSLRPGTWLFLFSVLDGSYAHTSRSMVLNLRFSCVRGKADPLKPSRYTNYLALTPHVAYLPSGFPVLEVCIHDSDKAIYSAHYFQAVFFVGTVFLRFFAFFCVFLCCFR